MTVAFDLKTSFDQIWNRIIMWTTSMKMCSEMTKVCLNARKCDKRS